jgi:phage-related protein
MNGDGTENDPPAKALFWMSSSLDDLRAFPSDVRQVMGFALWQAQNGRKHMDAKPLKGFGGASVLEIVADDDRGTFRGVYTVRFAGAVYVLHCFQKKSKKGIKTPQRELDLIRKRLRLAEQDYQVWRSSRPRQEENP